MNLYFLVEGQTEAQLYPAWLESLLPHFQRVGVAAEAVDNHYYLISGQGYPQIIYEGLTPAVEEINEHGNYDYLIVVVDSDDLTFDERMAEVLSYSEPLTTQLGRCQMKVVVQTCCLESWLLGNRNVFSRNPQSEALRHCITHYDVYTDDPELMPAPAQFMGSKAKYHFKYLKRMLEEKNIVYNKTSTRDTHKPYYLQQLIQRTETTPTHLHSFQQFIQFCGAL